MSLRRRERVAALPPAPAGPNPRRTPPRGATHGRAPTTISKISAALLKPAPVATRLPTDRRGLLPPLRCPCVVPALRIGRVPGLVQSDGPVNRPLLIHRRKVCAVEESGRVLQQHGFRLREPAQEGES